MRRTAWLGVLIAMTLMTDLAIAAGPPVKSRSPDDKVRIRKQVKSLAREIDKQSKDRKLLYMVLLLHGGSSDKAIDFYRKNFGETEEDLFIRMAYGNALTERGVHPDAAGVFGGLSHKYASNRLKARTWYSRGINFLSCSRELGRACFRAAIENHVDPTYAPAYFMLGDTTDDHAEAIVFYTKTLALEQPDTILAHKALKELLNELEANPDAIPK